jgi:hypothetical protein
MFVEHLLSVISETYFSPKGGDDSDDGRPTDIDLEEFYQRIQNQSEARKDSVIDLSLSGSEHQTSASCADFIELLLRFILIAVSRTYASGDAFFVIEDLFGGEGLCLCGGGSGSNKKKQPEKKTQVKVSSDHVLVELFQHYHLYHAESIGSDEAQIAPLVSFEAKVFTLITFRPPTSPETTPPNPSELWDHFLLLSASPERICHRLLTVIPFLP